MTVQTEPMKFLSSFLSRLSDAASVAAKSFSFAGTFYAHAMPSFDIVSQVNSMEIENAVNRPKKNWPTASTSRKQAEIPLEKSEIKLTAEDHSRSIR